MASAAASAALFRNPSKTHQKLPSTIVFKPLDSVAKSLLFINQTVIRASSAPGGTSSLGLYSAQTFELTVANVDLVLEDVMPYLIADGGNVDVVSVDDGVISLQLQGENQAYEEKMASRVFRGCKAMLAAAKARSAEVSSAAAIPKKPKRKASKTVAPGSGLLKPNPVSPALGDFLGGVSAASRSDAVKKIWEHIKVNNLQDPANKKVIHCDPKLKTIFEGKDQVGFHEIAKLLSAHFVKTPSS